MIRTTHLDHIEEGCQARRQTVFSQGRMALTSVLGHLMEVEAAEEVVDGHLVAAVCAEDVR